MTKGPVRLSIIARAAAPLHVWRCAGLWYWRCRLLCDGRGTGHESAAAAGDSARVHYYARHAQRNTVTLRSFGFRP